MRMGMRMRREKTRSDTGHGIFGHICRLGLVYTASMVIGSRRPVSILNCPSIERVELGCHTACIGELELIKEGCDQS